MWARSQRGSADGDRCRGCAGVVQSAGGLVRLNDKMMARRNLSEMVARICVGRCAQVRHRLWIVCVRHRMAGSGPVSGRPWSEHSDVGRHELSFTVLGSIVNEWLNLSSLAAVALAALAADPRWPPD